MKKRKIKVLVLIHEYPPVGTGGGQVAEGIAQDLIKHGCNICVITPNVNISEFPEKEIRGGVRIIRIPTKRLLLYKSTFKDMASYIVFGFRTTWKIVRDWKPDIIHVHFAVPAGALAWAITRFFRIPYVITAHLGDVPGGAPNKTNGWFRWIYPLTPMIWNSAAKITAVSEYTRKLALQSYKKAEIQVIQNGVKYKTNMNRKIQIINNPRIIFAGRFVAQKNPVYFVRILAQLKDLPWDCIMLGDGPLFSQTKAEISANNLQKRIKLTGWVTLEKTIEELDKSDILLMPSLSEGTPMVGLHALCAGLAIVGGRVGGFGDLVEHGMNGFLYPPDDHQGMQDGLRKLLQDKKTLIAAREYSRKIAPKFDLDNVVKKYLTVFEEVINH